MQTLPMDDLDAIHLTEFLDGPGGQPDDEDADRRVLPPLPVFQSAIDPATGVRMVAGPLLPGMLIRMLPGVDPVYRVESAAPSRAFCMALTGKVRKVWGGGPAMTVGGYVEEFETSGEGVNITVNALVELVDPDSLGDAFQRRAARIRLQDGRPLTQKEPQMGAVSGIPVADKSNRERNRAARANKASAVAGRAAAKGKPVRAKVVKTVRKCACGCGEETMSYFAPGHDARYHGWEKKLLAGTFTPDSKEIPKAVRDRMALKKKGEGFVATVDYKGDKI